MKQLQFVFAAAVGIAFISAGADGATRYSNTMKRHELYQNYTGCNYAGCKPAAAPVAQERVWNGNNAYEPVRQPTARTSTYRSSNQVMLADPFFQPAKGRVGSLTDLAYAENVYDFEIINGLGNSWDGAIGEWKASEIAFKEDLSVGITDNFALIGMAKYASTDYEVAWQASSTDTFKDSGIAIWGLGGQWKFFEDNKNVDNVGVFFQSSDVAQNIMATGKFGFKTTSDTTVYGLANLAYIMWENTSYGNGIVSNTGQVAYMAFERDVSKSFYVEGGAGVFTKLSDQWSLNAEAILGNYSWHSQLYAKAAVYWQPNDIFALGFYGRASLWDSADSAKDIYTYTWCESATSQCYIDNGSDPLSLEAQYVGTSEIQKYQDMQIGVQGMLYF